MSHRFFWSLICSILSSGPALAQTDSGLTAFYEALYTTETGASKRITRISWWGDSAVASDGYTGALRAVLQRRFGDGGPGFLLIDPTYRGYVHKRVRLTRFGWKSISLLQVRGRNRLLGLAGMMSKSFGGAGTTYTSKGGFFRRATLFYRAGPRAGDVQLTTQDRGTHFQHSTRAARVQSAVWVQALPAKTRVVRLRAAGKGSVGVFGLVLETQGPGLTLDTLGMVGLRARGLGRLDPVQFKKQLGLRKPDLVTIHFGGNERVDPYLSAKRHAAEIEILVKRLRAGAPQASCLILSPLPHGRRMRGKTVNDTRLDVVIQAQRQVAKANGCAFFDAIAAFGGPRSAQLMRDKKWLVRDLAHLSPSGHQEVARRVARWLIQGYETWKERRVLKLSVPRWENEAH